MQLAEEDELMWDDGSANPEPCLDEFNLVTKVAPTSAWPPPLTQMRLSQTPRRPPWCLVLRLQPQRAERPGGVDCASALQ